MKIYWTFILVGVGFISMHTLPGFYIYTPPIHQYPSRNLHFPFFWFHSSGSSRFTANISSANFLLFRVHICPSLRCCTISIFSAFSCPLFSAWYFHLIQLSSNLPVLCSSFPIFQYYILVKQLSVFLLFLCLFY